MRGVTRRMKIRTWMYLRGWLQMREFAACVAVNATLLVKHVGVVLVEGITRGTSLLPSCWGSWLWQTA
jgi:hypothetical protein